MRASGLEPSLEGLDHPEVVGPRRLVRFEDCGVPEGGGGDLPEPEAEGDPAQGAEGLRQILGGDVGASQEGVDGPSGGEELAPDGLLDPLEGGLGDRLELRRSGGGDDPETDDGDRGEAERDVEGEGVPDHGWGTT